MYLITWEPFIIKPDNWNLENHKYFRKIFTWNDKLVDNEKYFKINYSFIVPNDIDIDIDKKKNYALWLQGTNMYLVKVSYTAKGLEL